MKEFLQANFPRWCIKRTRRDKLYAKGRELLAHELDIMNILWMLRIARVSLSDHLLGKKKFEMISGLVKLTPFVKP